MYCPYCNVELMWDDVFGKNLRLDSWNRVKPGFEKIGDIYRCGNEECEYQGYFYMLESNDNLYEGYPC